MCRTWRKHPLVGGPPILLMDKLEHVTTMIRLMDKIRVKAKGFRVEGCWGILHDLIYLNYGIYGIILYLGHADFCPSTVCCQRGRNTWEDLLHKIGVTLRD